jgi:hypothetical protein
MTGSCLRRYTTLPFLLDILETKKLTLSDPAWWEDKNDYAYLELYKHKADLKSILVLCFAEAPELFSHWKGYAGNSSGVCIEFDKARLLQYFPEKDGIKSSYMKYETLENLQSRQLALDELPFIKRYGFIDDREFRIISCQNHHTLHRKSVRITLDCISGIILGPMMYKEIALSVEKVIRKIDGCKHIPIRKSHMTHSRRWTQIGENLNLNISS